MTWDEICEQARSRVNPKCKACPVCDGRACGNRIPGPGAKGYGDVARRNFDAWRNVRINLDTLCAGGEVDTQFTHFGRTFAYPIFAGPVSDVRNHYGDFYNDETYSDALIAGCLEAGTAAFMGDCIDPVVFSGIMKSLKNAGGAGIPTIKPWDIETARKKFAAARESCPFAFAMDVDAAGLPFLKGRTPPAGCKSEEELAEIIREAELSFIVKGIMTPDAAEKAIRAGAAAIVVSNHGGRVLDGCPSTAEVLPAIADAVAGRVTIFVDGGIRSGLDVFRALALGADAVIVARPYVTAAYGAGREGVAFLTRKLGQELSDTMELCGARQLSDITRRMLFLS